jgi:invasion protein IalB
LKTHAYRSIPFALAVLAGLSAVAFAQGSKQTKDTKASPAKQAAAPAPAGGSQPTLLGQFGDWGAYTATNGGKKVCYALAKPGSQATDPPKRPRDPAYTFVSTRPSENVHNEISIVIGYPFKPGFEAAVDIGTQKYAMYTQGDGAWIKNAAEEARMIEAMRKGADMVVTGESGRGTKSTDRYSLKGLAQALDRVSQECK